MPISLMGRCVAFAQPTIRLVEQPLLCGCVVCVSSANRRKKLGSRIWMGGWLLERLMMNIHGIMDGLLRFYEGTNRLCFRV